MNRTFIIAEIGVNHNGSYKLAIELIKKAKIAGADAVKFQMYDLEANYNKKKTNTKIIQWSKSLKLSEKDFIKINNFCNKNKIEFISSVFDERSLNNYLKLKPKIIKIPSSEVFNFNLIEEIKKANLKIIFSSGITDLNEIKIIKKKLLNTKTIKHKKLKNNLYCLYCVSKYPTRYEDIDLKNINIIEKRCKVKTGFSDHTLGIEASIIAAFLGVPIIEKHIKIDENHNCPDEKVSITVNDFKKMVDSIRIAEKISIHKSIDNNNIDFTKKGFYAKTTITKNTKIKKEYLMMQKPNLSNNLKLENIIGKITKYEIKEDEPIKKNNISS